MKTLLLLLLISFTLSSVAAAATEDDLMRYLPPGEARWLESDGNRYLLLERESLQAITRGVIIHIPDWAQHPLQTPLLTNLYQQLPEYGWTTFALHPPTSRIQTDMLQFPAVDERYPEPVSEETLAPLRDSLRQRLQPLMNELSDYTGFVVLVAEGMTAAFLTEILNEDLQTGGGIVAPVQPDALIVIDPYMPQYSLNKAVGEKLAVLPLPVFDVTTASANRWVKQTQRQRKLLAQREQHLSYRQQQLPLLTSGNAEQTIPEFIGWLRYQGF